MRQEIPVMFCFDTNYVIQAGVTFYSLLEHANKNYKYHFFVLHSDITESQQEKLMEIVESFGGLCKLDFLNMEHQFEDIWNEVYAGGHFSKEVMYKILIASIFPQYEKIIVTDVDVVFLGDISKSYTEFSVKDDVYLAGVSPVGKIDSYMETYRPNWTDEEIKKLGHICGGYLVANLSKIREDNMEEVFIDFFIKNGYRLNQMEQDILNICCYPKIKYLPLNYVACSYLWDFYKTEEDKSNDRVYTKKEIEDAMENPIQLHYATSTKPWKNVNCTKSEIWFQYLVKTPFLSDYLNWLPDHIVLNNKAPLKKRGLIYRGLRYIKHNPLFMFNKKFYEKIFIKLRLKFCILKKNKILFILDDVFPCSLSPFRYEEYQYYLEHFKDVHVLTTGTSLPALKVKESIQDVIKEYAKKHPKRKNIFTVYPFSDNIEKDKFCLKSKSYKNRLAVITFLNNLENQLYDNIKLLDSYNIPFIFTLYPGGGFRLNSEESDRKLKKAFSSPNFRGVIVTQKTTYDYLVDNNFCEKEKIMLIPGVVTPKELLNVDLSQKKHYGDYNKETLDICFVAHKYMEQGKDKGYDVFIEVAKKIAKKHSNVFFHIVGNFDENDIEIEDIKDRVTFYGIQPTNWFKTFYMDKDIILSPNRSFKLSKGSFDGFPTGAATEAMLHEVVLFATDELKQNVYFKDKKDMIFINHSTNDIVKKIEHFYNNPQELKNISKNGRKTVLENYSIEKQMGARIKFIEEVFNNNK